MSPSRKYDDFDEEVAALVVELHKRHPKLGHHGLLEALRDSGIHVDSKELQEFMGRNRIRAEKPWRPWRLLGLPKWYINSAGSEPDRPRKFIRWRLW